MGEREREKILESINEREVELYFSSILKPKGYVGYLIDLTSLGGVI